jgi:hypothetical protein
VLKSSEVIGKAINGSCILICSEFEQDNAGSHRQARWVRQYTSECASVTVIFPRGFFGAGSKSFNSNDDVDAFRDSVAQTGKIKKTSHFGFIAKLLRVAKYYLFIEFLLPCNFAVAYRLMLTIGMNGNVRVVSISSPPFPLAFFSSILVKLFSPHIRVHLDMRDPWATHHTLGGSKPAKRLLERICMRRVDVVTAATRSMVDEFQTNYGIEAQVVYNVATHITNLRRDTVGKDDEKQIDLTAATSSSVRIVYVGTMPEGFYDLELLADWLVCLQKDKQNGETYEWLFVGECDRLESKINARLCTYSGIRFSSRVAHEKAVEFMCNADVLLFIGHQFPGYLTTKLFEYLAVRKRILPLFLSKDSEAYRLIADICYGCPSIQTYGDFKESINNYHQLPRPIRESTLHEMRSAYSRIAHDLVGHHDKL